MITVIALCHVMFRSLIEMIDTVASDKVFTDANANRLRSIAWALLGFCVVEHIYGFLALHYVPPLVEWSPTLTGWLVSLMLFVLASVWQQGVAMREDLEGTV